MSKFENNLSSLFMYVYYIFFLKGQYKRKIHCRFGTPHSKKFCTLYYYFRINVLKVEKIVSGFVVKEVYSTVLMKIVFRIVCR